MDMLLAALLTAWSSAPLEAQGPVPPPPAEPAWTWSMSFYTIDPPDDDVYAATILRADRGSLHLEGRYNYEDLDTGSFWVGRSYGWTDEVSGQVVPMVGLVAGDTDGAALGLELDAQWHQVSLYSESEYLFDFDDADDNFFYCWNELGFAATDWLTVGLVGQRTRVYDTDLEVDRGFLIGVEKGPITFTLYWFNPDRDDPYVALWLGLSA